MDLPSHITDEIFEKEFKRGAILSTEMVFPKTGERKREYIIILNQNPAEAETLLFLTLKYRNKRGGCHGTSPDCQ